MKQKLQQYLHQKTHILWDWNGTLIDDRELCVEVINVMLKEENLPTLSMEQYRATFCFPIFDYYKALGLNTSSDSFEKLAVRFTDLYRAGVRDCKLYPHAENSLREFAEENFKQCILSAAKENHLKTLLNHFKIDHHFDHVYGLSDDYAASKIERGRELLQKLQVEKESLLLIGDTDHDAAVGRNLGIDVVLIAEGHQAEERLRAIHDRVIASK